MKETNGRMKSNSRTKGASPRRPLAVLTIISRNYLAQARVLAKSFLEHEPQSRFYLLVVDSLPPDAELESGITLLRPEELNLPDFNEFCFKYTLVEFNTAVKPYCLALLMERYGEEELVYLDPDILVMKPLDEVRDAFSSGNIVLTPHITRPIPRDGLHPTEADLLFSGVYNLGFIALKSSPDTRQFLNWWEERLEEGCTIDTARGLFTDQKWIDLVPSLFPSTVILRDPTYNVAYWNLHERTIGRSGGKFSVNGSPLTFYHFSGFHPDQPHLLCKHQVRGQKVEQGTPLAELLHLYADLLMEQGYWMATRWPYGYATFDNGLTVHPLLRKLYLNLSPEERKPFGNPFQADHSSSFFDWATRTRPEQGGLSLFLRSLYDSRYDLQALFPDVSGQDREAFLKWAVTDGPAQMRFDPELVRVHPSPPPQAAGPGTVEPAGIPEQPAAQVARSHRTTKELNPEEYEGMIARIRHAVRTRLPEGAVVMVVSKGESRLIQLDGRLGWHFPQSREGDYGDFYPPDSATAIALLEMLRRKGGEYLLIPCTASWWLEHYEEFYRHLEGCYQPFWEDEDCLIYRLKAQEQSFSGAAVPPPSR